MAHHPLSNSPWSMTANSSRGTMDADKHSLVGIDTLSKTDLDKLITEAQPLQNDDITSPSRARTNSLIPKDLMANSNMKGGRECAALATVFGVPEYMDSKIFWERQQYQAEALMSRKHFLRPNSPGKPLGNNNAKQSSILYLKSTDKDNSSTSSNCEYLNKHFISNYVDAVLDPVGSDSFLDTNLLKNGAVLSAPMPIPTISFALPKIPTVSEFDDILSTNTTDDNKESVYAALSTATSQDNAKAYYSSCLTLLQQPDTVNDKNDIESLGTSSIERILIGTPDVFDFIQYDNDERFIIWGPDPIALSSSMATTTQAQRPSSYATVYQKHYHTRPTLKGFSSNVTAASVVEQKETTQKQQDNKQTSKTKLNSGSMRKSAQNLAKTLNRLSRPASAGNREPEDQTQHTSLFFKKALKPRKNQDNEKVAAKAISSSNNVSEIPQVIEAASAYKLIEKLTTFLDYTFMTDFFLTYRDFLHPEDLCQLLILRFYWALQSDEEKRKIVRIRTFVVFRHWLNNYFVHDFIGHQRLRVLLVTFLNELPEHPLIKRSSRDQRIVKMLKRVVRRLKKLYYHQRSASSRESRVKVIAPPPPTAEQMQIEDIVRAKLSYGKSIRHKASFGVAETMKSSHVHHHGNMAIQDARYAPVLIVGSLNVKGAGGSFTDSGVDTVGSQFGKPLSFFSHQMMQDRMNSKISKGSVEDVAQQSPTAANKNHVHSSSHQTEVEGVIHTDRDDARSIKSSNTADNSLLSEVTAGETLEVNNDRELENAAENLYEKFEEAPKSDELEIDWLKEQRATIEFFHPSEHFSTPNHSSMAPKNESIFDIQSTMDAPLSVTRSEVNNKNTDRYDKESLALQNGMPTSISVEDLENSSRKNIRRVPSERWCRTGEERQHSQHHRRATAEGTLPAALLEELQGYKLRTSVPHGLAKKLSRKSIERRKSERRMIANSNSMDFSSTATSVITSTPSNSSLKENVEQASADKLRKLSLSRKIAHNKKSRRTILKRGHDDEATETLQTGPYEQTRTTSKIQSPTEGMQSADVSEVQDEVKIASKIEPDNSNSKQPEKSQLLALVAQRLRHNSVDENERGEGNSCVCIDCIGNNSGATDNANRLSVLLLNDDERRHSVELRRKRATSVEMDQQVEQCRADADGIEETKDKDERHSADTINDTKGVCYGKDEVEQDADGYIENVSMKANDSVNTPPQCDGSKTSKQEIVVSDLTTKSCYPAIHRPILSIGRYGSSNRSFIMAYKTSQLASQFCLIERDVLTKVGWEELIHCKWTQMDANGNINSDNVSRSNVLSTFGVEKHITNYTLLTERKRALDQGVEKVIQRFNFVCQWVSSEIVRTENINERVKLIEKFIRLAQKCDLYSNYATLVQILLGLQSPAVARLEKTWAKVSTKCQKQLSKLTEFTSPIRNWKNIRDSMTEVAEEYGNSPAEVQVEMPGTTSAKPRYQKTARIKIPFGGCIPFLGIYLSDLVFNSENPRFLQPNLESQKIYNANSKVGLPLCLDQPLINFRKYRVVATVIKRVLTFQNLSMRYAFEEDLALLEKCRDLQVLDAVTVRALSASLE